MAGGVGGEDGAVEFFVGEFEPGGALVVEVCEGALLEASIFGGGGHDGGLADQGTGLGRYVFKVVGGVDAVGEGLEPFGGIEPALAHVVEFFGGVSDAAIGRVFDRFLARRPREGEGFKAGRGCVAGTIFKLCSLLQRPHRMNGRLEHPEHVVVRSGKGKRGRIGQRRGGRPREEPVLGDAAGDKKTAQRRNRFSHGRPAFDVQPPPLSVRNPSVADALRLHILLNPVKSCIKATRLKQVRSAAKIDSEHAPWASRDVAAVDPRHNHLRKWLAV